MTSKDPAFLFEFTKRLRYKDMFKLYSRGTLKKNLIFITGTDTGAGKSVLSLLLMHYFASKGDTPFYIKPFQTGCSHPGDTDSDAAFVYRSLPSLENRNPADSIIYCLETAKAPLFAARDQQVTLDMDRVYSFIREKHSRETITIVEGAGGLFVPVTETTSMADMIRETGAFPLIAARAGLGTINHCLLTIEALKKRGIDHPGLVFIQQPDDPTPPEMVRENMEAVTLYSGITVAGVIPPIRDFSHPDPAIFTIFDHIF